MVAASYDACVDATLDQLGAPDGPLLPVLHAIQHQCGYVPADAVPLIAERLNLSRAEVHGVLSYYHHFRKAPAGKLIVQLCRAEACQSVGADALAEHAKGTKVKVLLESHGDLVYIDDIEKVMQAATHEHVGLVWDICNMWVVTKEQPADVYNRLKKYIYHTHIKDATLS